MSNFHEMEKAFVDQIGPVPVGCPPLDLLRAHGQSVLPEKAEAEVGHHLAQCPVCQMLLSDLSSLDEQNLTHPARNRIRTNIPVPRQESTANRFRWYIISAVAASLILVAFWLSSGRLHRVSTTQSAASPAPSTQTMADLQIAKLAPPQEAEAGLVFRGAVSDSEPDATELAPAFDVYNKGDYPLAAIHFRQLASRFPKSDVPVLYLGVSQLLAGDNSSALESLTKADALAKPSHKDAASWYHAAAAVRAQSADAGALLQSVCSRRGSPYSQQACSLSASAQ